MKVIKADFDNWHIQCIPGDGGRISVLRFAGYDLLTPEPVAFKSPGHFFGEYETRPVYGYDDCFPTVDPCVYPGAIPRKNNREIFELAPGDGACIVVNLDNRLI